jgi:hypothetical protein
MVATPAYGGQVHSAYCNSLTATEAALWLSGWLGIVLGAGGMLVVCCAVAVGDVPLDVEIGASALPALSR